MSINYIVSFLKFFLQHVCFTPALLTARHSWVYYFSAIYIYSLHLYELLFWSSCNTRWSKLTLRQVHIIQPCHYHQVNHVISWQHLTQLTALTSHSVSPTWEATPCTLSVLFCQFSYFFTTLPSTFFIPSYSCVLLYIFFFLIHCLLLRHLNCSLYQTYHLLPPTLPLCPNSVSLTFYPHAGSLSLVCHPPYLLSSLMSPFSQCLSNLVFLCHLSNSLPVCLSLPLRHSIDNSGAVLWSGLTISED